MIPYFENLENQNKFKTILESWFETPYLHMGAQKGVGVDCTKFVGLSLVELGVLKQIAPREFYYPDWYQHSKTEVVLESFDQHIKDYLKRGYKIERFEYGEKPLLFGDVLGFSYKSKLTNHTAFIWDPGHMVHCFNGVGIAKVQFGRRWTKRATYHYRLFIEEIVKDQSCS